MITATMARELCLNVLDNDQRVKNIISAHKVDWYKMARYLQY